MPCPWYQHGLCVSPRLPEPTESVVAVDRCSSDILYTNCTYYVPESSKEVFTSFKKAAAKRDRAKIYAPIHALPPQLNCECSECEMYTTENGVKTAYCKIVNRYLTKYEVYYCNKYWRDCPYRSLHTSVYK